MVGGDVFAHHLPAVGGPQLVFNYRFDLARDIPFILFFDGIATSSVHNEAVWEIITERFNMYGIN